MFETIKFFLRETILRYHGRAVNSGCRDLLCPLQAACNA